VADHTGGEASPPGWYSDPWQPDAVRWWDGFQWTDSASSLTGTVNGSVSGGPGIGVVDEQRAAHTLHVSPPTPAMQASQAPANSAPPVVPGVLEGSQWIIGTLAALLLAIAAFAFFLVTALKSHDWTDWLVGGILFAGLLGCSLRLSRTRYLQLDREGVTVHNFWRNWHIAWGDIRDVDLVFRNGDGMRFATPTIRLQNGESCKIYGLGEMSNVHKAQVNASMILAARDANS